MKTLQIEIPKGFKVESFDEVNGLLKFAPLPKDIKERVKTIDDAIAILGASDKDVVDYRVMQSLGLQDHILGNQELVIIIKALNEGWIPNWSNGKWDKWFPWFDFNTDNEKSSSSPGRFSFHGSDLQLSDSDCGSRLCLKSKELSDYAGKQFLDIYKKVYTI
jgi:hypothetical protein